jgi:hypothetical protein
MQNAAADGGLSCLVTADAVRMHIMLLACFSHVSGQVIALKEGGNMLERDTLSQLHALDKKIKVMTIQEVCCKLKS